MNARAFIAYISQMPEPLACPRRFISEAGNVSSPGSDETKFRQKERFSASAKTF
jgi:hypothetical protein